MCTATEHCPDSAVFHTALIHQETQQIKFMKKSMLNYGDTSSVMLYMRFFDPGRNIKPLRSAKDIDSSQYHILDISTGVNPYPMDSLTTNLKNSIPSLKMMLAQVNHSPTMKIYLSGAGKDQILETLFLEAVAKLKELMTEVKLDTSAFKLRTFNK